jgi:hypothetical protein
MRRRSAWLVIAVLPALASCDVNQSLRVWRFVSTSGTGPTMTNSVADSILSAATAALRTDDGAGDRACGVRLDRNGDVGTFTAGDGSIDTPAEYAAIMAQPGNVKIVNAINWCGGVLAGILACGDEPGRSFAAIRGGSDGLVWAHALGHNAGLSDRDEWPTLGFAGLKAQGGTEWELIQPWWNDQFLALETYRANGTALSPLWKQEGGKPKPSALVGYLYGDFDGDRRDDVLELSTTNGQRLGMALLHAEPKGFSLVWSADDVGRGPDALAWLVADIDNDGRMNVIQPWSNAGRLGMTVFAWNGSAIAPQWSTTDIGHSSSALWWRIGDIDGDGRAEVIQASRSGDQLDLILYDWSGGAMRVKFAAPGIGRSTGTLAWLVSDIDGDRKAELLQPWWTGDERTSAPLQFVVYGWDGSAMRKRWETSDMGQGAGALSWLVGDIDGDGKGELLQPWDNGGVLGLLVYEWRAGAVVARWGSPDVGQRSRALDWLTRDFNGDGRDEILQLVNNDASLGAILYGWTGTGMTARWGAARLSSGPDAIMNQTNSAQHTKVYTEECYAYRDW